MSRDIELEDYENIQVESIMLHPEEWDALKEGDRIEITREVDEDSVISITIGRGETRGEESDDSPINFRAE